MGLVGNVNFFYQTLTVQEILSFKVGKVLFQKREKVPFWSVLIFFAQEGVEIFEF